MNDADTSEKIYFKYEMEPIIFALVNGELILLEYVQGYCPKG